MKVILNQDVAHLGEMGDTKNVAAGYARNFLFPHAYALPYNDETVAYFEGKKAEIEARKEQKRKDSASLKDKLEALNIEFDMPAGSNGKLYGAVTSQTISDYLKKNGIDIERKRIDIPGLTIKSTGNYHANIRLYESQVAEIKVVIKAQGGAENGPTDEEKAKAAQKEAAKAAKEAAKDAPAEEAKAEETK